MEAVQSRAVNKNFLSLSKRNYKCCIIFQYWKKYLAFFEQLDQLIFLRKFSWRYDYFCLQYQVSISQWSLWFCQFKEKYLFLALLVQTLLIKSVLSLQDANLGCYGCHENKKNYKNSYDKFLINIFLKKYIQFSLQMLIFYE